MVAVLENEDQGEGQNLSDEEQAENKERVPKETLLLQGSEEIHVQSLNEVEDQPVRIGEGEDAKDYQQLKAEVIPQMVVISYLLSLVLECVFEPGKHCIDEIES